MTAPMSMNKVIHGAVRRDLERLLMALSEFPDGSPTRAGELRAAWSYFYEELDYHHHGEHDIAWPALRELGVADSLLQELDAEHDQLAAALAESDAAFNTLHAAPTLANATLARSAVTRLRDV